MGGNGGTGKLEPDRNHGYLRAGILVFVLSLITDQRMVRVSSTHQAYIVNRMGYDGMTALKTEKLNTCKKAPEEKTEMTVSHLKILSLHKDNN
jgi:acid phosphatase family membrane protein YuiD